MAVTVTSFDGTTLNDATFSTRLLAATGPWNRSAEPVLVSLLDRFPANPRFNKQPGQIVLHTEVLTAALSDVRTLQQTFRAGTSGLLIINDGTNSIEVTARVQNTTVMVESPRSFIVSLVAPDPRWRLTSQDTTTWNITATGQTQNVTNSGTAIEDLMTIDVKPTTAKATANGFTKMREIVLANRIQRSFSNWAIDVTGGGFNHAGEVSGGDAQADGDDLRIRVDGVEVPRWSENFNNASTLVWINLTLAPAKIAEVLTAMTAGSPADNADLTVAPGGTVGWPSSGAMLIENEVITYDGIDGDSFQNIDRGARNTTAASHSAGTSIFWVEHRVQMVYGYSGASAPAARDDLEPLIDLTNSTNTALVWAEFFDDDNPRRSMQWSKQVQARDNQTDRILITNGAPATDLTFEYQTDGAVAGKPNANAMVINLPPGTVQSSNAFSFTRAIDDTLGLRYYATDEDGSEVLLDTESGPQASGTKNIAADTTTSYFSFTAYCRSQVIVSNPSGSLTTESILGTSPSGDWQQFTVPSDGTITGWAMRVRAGSATPRTVTSELYTTDRADTTEQDYRITSQPTDTTTGSSTTWLTFTPTSDAIVYAGVQLWLGAFDNAGSDSFWQIVTTPFSGGLRADGAAGSSTPGDGVYEFRIHSMDIDFDDQASAVDAETATIDGFTANLLSTTVPYVSLGSEQTIYWLNTVLTNNGTGDSVTFDAIVTLNDVVTIDMDARTVINTTTGENLLPSTTFSNEDDWITLPPGTDQFQNTEAGVVAMTVTFNHYDRWE